MKKLFFIVFSLFCQLTTFAQLNTDRILDIGQNALYFEDYVLSIQYFNQVINIKPYLAEPYLYRATAKVQLGDFQGADQDCSEAIERNPFLPRAYYIRGFARRKMKFYTEAIDDFSKALEFSPNNPNLIMSRIDAREKNGDFKGALNDLDLYAKIQPKSNSILYDKGVLYLSMKDTIGALTYLNQFIESDSSNFGGWSARGLLKMQTADLDGALLDYNQAINRNSSNVGDFINRGIINVQKKNYIQALKDYDQGIKLDNKNALAYYNRALLRANLGDNNNALVDFNTVLQLDTTNYEALLRKAMLEHDLKNYKNAILDYNKIIRKFQYFIPAYQGIARAEMARGNEKEAFRYAQIASNIEKNKDYINKKNKEDIKVNNKIATAVQQSKAGKNTNLFNLYLNQNPEESTTETKYAEKERGTVQDRHTDIVNERNFVLSYYAKENEIRQTNLYYPSLVAYNKTKKISSVLKITNNEIPLTAELINSHFAAINNISSSISIELNDADVYFNRAIEFALVQDFNSSIEDVNKALKIRPNFMLAYFFRANIRYKLIDYIKNTKSESNQDVSKDSKEKQSNFDFELIMRDYDEVIKLNPDFTFAYFNKANLLCTQKNFKTAIANYTKAIQIDKDFAEAYYNRGLTYLFIDEDAKGLADLSKAGELGIYKAYNLLQRFKK